MAIAAALGAGALLAAATPASAALDAVQYTYTASFGSGIQAATNVSITPITATGKVFVIQTVSIYRSQVSTSTLQSFIGVTYGGKTGYFSLPDIASSNDFYPATTANLTAYVTGGTSAFMNLYRTGGSYPAETDYITVSGYITAGS